MKKRKKTIPIFAAAALSLVLTLILTGCQRPSLREIAGVYKEESTGSEMTVNRDGTFYESVGLTGSCEIVDDRLVLRAGSFSVVYDIDEQDGHIILSHGAYSVYIPADYYDDYKRLAESEAQKEQEAMQAALDAHKLAGQYLWREFTDAGELLRFVDFSQDWNARRMEIHPLLPDDLNGPHQDKIYFSFSDDGLLYYNNADLAFWRYDSASGFFADGDGAPFYERIHWYEPGKAAEIAVDYDLETGQYHIDGRVCELRPDGSLSASDNGPSCTLTPTEFIYQFNL